MIKKNLPAGEGFFILIAAIDDHCITSFLVLRVSPVTASII